MPREEFFLLTLFWLGPTLPARSSHAWGLFDQSIITGRLASRSE